MDTIVKICCHFSEEQKLNKSNPADYSYRLKVVSLQDCQMINISLQEQAVSHNDKQDRKLLGGFACRRHGEKMSVHKHGKIWSILRHIFAWLRRPFHRLKMQKAQRLQEKQVQELREEISAELAPLLDEMGDNYQIFEESLPRSHWVRNLLPLPEFEAYSQPKWIRQLLPYAVNDHFVILGSAPCLHELLNELAPRMKSLLWIAPDLAYQEQLEDLAEDFYQENGLAIQLYFVPAGGTYGHIRIRDDHYSEPVNLLDFTGERYVPAFDPPEGSVWLDFAPLCEKERRISARRLRVKYFSLRTL